METSQWIWFSFRLHFFPEGMWLRVSCPGDKAGTAPTPARSRSGETREQQTTDEKGIGMLSDLVVDLLRTMLRTQEFDAM